MYAIMKIIGKFEKIFHFSLVCVKLFIFYLKSKKNKKIKKIWKKERI